MSNVIAFNAYDYPSGLERGNLFARMVGTAIRLPGTGPVFARMENRMILASTGSSTHEAGTRE